MIGLDIQGLVNREVVFFKLLLHLQHDNSHCWCSLQMDVDTKVYRRLYYAFIDEKVNLEKMESYKWPKALKGRACWEKVQLVKFFIQSLCIIICILWLSTWTFCSKLLISIHQLFSYFLIFIVNIASISLPLSFISFRLTFSHSLFYSLCVVLVDVECPRICHLLNVDPIQFVRILSVEVELASFSIVPFINTKIGTSTSSEMPSTLISDRNGCESDCH